LQLTLRVVASSDQGFSQQKADEVRAALRELGLTDVVVVER
jgi:methylmalonyl-CoA mutase cobalamin-binding subunit